MNTKYILLIILVILAYLVYRYWKFTNMEVNKANFNNANNTANQLSNYVSSQSGSVEVISPNVPPVIQPGQYVIGSNVYGGPTGVNSYNTPSPSTTSLDKFWHKDELIGTFLADEGKGYIKVITKRSVGTIESLFGYQENMVVWVAKNQVYTK